MILYLTLSAASRINCLAASSQISGTMRTHCMSVSLISVHRFSRVSSKWPLKYLMAAEKTSIANIFLPSAVYNVTAFESCSFEWINCTNLTTSTLDILFGFFLPQHQSFWDLLKKIQNWFPRGIGIWDVIKFWYWAICEFNENLPKPYINNIVLHSCPLNSFLL